MTALTSFRYCVCSPTARRIDMENRNPFYYWHSRPKRQRRRKLRDPEIWRDDPDDPAIPDREDPACWFHFAELLSDETLNRALQRWQLESLRDTGVTGADDDEVDVIKPIRFHAADGTVISAVDCLLQCILRCGQHGASSSASNTMRAPRRWTRYSGAVTPTSPCCPRSTPQRQGSRWTGVN
jgi:hypothetical protein